MKKTDHGMGGLPGENDMKTKVKTDMAGGRGKVRRSPGAGGGPKRTIDETARLLGVPADELRRRSIEAAMEIIQRVFLRWKPPQKI